MVREKRADKRGPFSVKFKRWSYSIVSCYEWYVPHPESPQRPTSLIVPHRPSPSAPSSQSGYLSCLPPAGRVDIRKTDQVVLCSIRRALLSYLVQHDYPLVNVYKKLWKITMLLMGKSENPLVPWPFSIANCNKLPEGNLLIDPPPRFTLQKTPRRSLNQELAPLEPRLIMWEWHHVAFILHVPEKNPRNLLKLRNTVGGAISPSWKMMEFVNGKDDIPYMRWKNKIHVPNHQPDIDDLPEVDRIWESIEVSMWFFFLGREALLKCPYSTFFRMTFYVYTYLHQDENCNHLWPPKLIARPWWRTTQVAQKKWNLPSPQWIFRRLGALSQ